MSKIKIVENVMVVTSNITTEDLLKLKKVDPRALVLVEKETKDEAFRVNYDEHSEGVLTEFGATFNRTSNDGYASLSILLPETEENDKKKTAIDMYGKALLKLNQFENSLKEVIDTVNAEFSKLSDAIEIV